MNKFICFHFIWKQFERSFLCLSTFSVESFRTEAFSEAIVSKFDYSNECFTQETLFLCSPSWIDIDAGFCFIDVATFV